MERLQFVRSVHYTNELPEQGFRIAPVPPWNSSMDHPNPWMAIPAFLANFPEVIERRRLLAPYWRGPPSTERYLVGSFLDALKSAEKWITAWHEHNRVGRAERLKAYAERGSKGHLPGSPLIKGCQFNFLKTFDVEEWDECMMNLSLGKASIHKE